MSDFSISKRVGRKPVYDWQGWLTKGSVMTLEKKIHYHCSTESMRYQAYHAAKSLGVKVECRIEGDKIEIKVQ